MSTSYRIFYACLTAAIAAMFLSLIILPADGHEWIKNQGYTQPSGASCCGGEDCKAISTADVRIGKGGYIVRLHGREYHFNENRLIPVRGPDGKAWACASPRLRERAGVLPEGYCLFYPGMW